jgi:type IV pilus assembly protein PilE
MRTSVIFIRTRAAHPGRAGGFTLIELMVTVIVVAILASIAIPSYTGQVRKSRRTEAKNALLDLAGREERYMSTNGAYTALGTQLGYPADAWPQATSSGYYNLKITNVAAAVVGTATTAGTPATFLITATAANSQAKDTQCASLTVDQKGAQLAYTSGSVATTEGW